MNSTSTSQPAAPSRWLILLAFAAVYFVWGSSYIGIRFAIETIPPFLMTAVRFLTSGTILIGFALARGAKMPTRIHWRSAAVAGGFLFLLNNSMIVWAQDHGLPSGVTAILLATMPMFMVLLNWVRGVRPTLVTMIGLLVGFAGMLLLVSPGSIAVENMHPLAPFAVLGASACWSFGALFARGADLPENGSLSTGMQLFAGGAMILILSLVTGDAATLDLSGISLTSAVAFFHLTIMSSILTFSAFVWMMKVVPPAKVATYAYVNPVIAMILGWALANEPLTERKLIAAAIILSGVVIITVYGGRRITLWRTRPVTGAGHV